MPQWEHLEPSWEVLLPNWDAVMRHWEVLVLQRALMPSSLKTVFQTECVQSLQNFYKLSTPSWNIKTFRELWDCLEIIKLSGKISDGQERYSLTFSDTLVTFQKLPSVFLEVFWLSRHFETVWNYSNSMETFKAVWKFFRLSGNAKTVWKNTNSPKTKTKNV